MKTNITFFARPLATVALLLTMFVSLSACDSTEPVKPKSVYGPVLPTVIPDTLTTDPRNPKPILLDSTVTVQPSSNES